MKLIVSVLALCVLLLSACGSAAEQPTQEIQFHSEITIPNPAELVIPTDHIPEPELDNETPPDFISPPPSQHWVDAVVRFENILAIHEVSEFVSAGYFHESVENIELLDEWVENYRLGISGRVVIVKDAGPFNSSLSILESDGSEIYTITRYFSIMNGEVYQPPNVFRSAHVVKREYDYIFGADLAAAQLMPYVYERPRVVVRRGIINIFDEENLRWDVERLDWNPNADAPLTGITPAEAEERAREVIAANFEIGGEFLHGDNIYSMTPIYYRTVGAIVLNNNIYYFIYSHSNEAALNRGEHAGTVVAVGLDGRLVFSQSMYDGSWIFVDDADEEIIMPNI